MSWKILENETQLNELAEFSYKKPQAIFKHSTRCSISSMAKNRVEKSMVDSIDFHYLDLIANRPLSNLIADKFNVHHESPQIILVKNGECIYDESHNGISVDELEAALQNQ